MVYDIKNPSAAQFVTYFNNRDFNVDPQEGNNAAWQEAGDLGPEGLTFIPASTSPNGKNLLAVGNEVSGTTTLFEVTPKNDGTSVPGNVTTSSDDGRLKTLGIIFASLCSTFLAVFTALVGFAPQLAPLRDQLQKLLG